MALSSYSDIKAKISEYLARGGMDSKIADAILMFEARYNGGENNFFAEQVATPTTVAGSPFMDLPADFNEEVTLFYADGTPIELVALTALNYSNVKARPRRAAVFPGSKLKFEVIADAAYELELVYEAKLAPLSDSAPTNWMVVQYPYLYVYGSLMFMLDYLQDGVRAETIEGRTKVFMDELDGKKAAKKLGKTPVMQTPRGCP